MAKTQQQICPTRLFKDGEQMRDTKTGQLLRWNKAKGLWEEVPSAVVVPTKEAPPGRKNAGT